MEDTEKLLDDLDRVPIIEPKEDAEFLMKMEALRENKIPFISDQIQKINMLHKKFFNSLAQKKVTMLDKIKEKMKRTKEQEVEVPIVKERNKQITNSNLTAHIVGCERVINENFNLYNGKEENVNDCYVSIEISVGGEVEVGRIKISNFVYQIIKDSIENFLKEN